MAKVFLVGLLGIVATRYFLIIALQCAHHESAEGVIVQAPTDAIVIANHSTVFNCSTSGNKSIEPTWYHYPLDGRGSVRQDVYEYERIKDKYKDRFAIDKNIATGAFNLLVQRPEPSDAGRYECVEDSLERDSGPSAELTVLDSNMVCESDDDLDEIVGRTKCDKPIAPDQLQLQCSVTYSGNFPPQMEWRKVGSEFESNMTDCGVKGNRVMCNTTLEANFNMDGSEYICQIKIAKQYNCSLKVVKTIYAFSDTSVAAKTTTGEVFCSANTSKDLPCSYKWYKDNKIEHLGQTLKPSTSGKYRCEAECKIRSEICAFTAMEIYVSEQESGLQTGFVLLIVAVVVILCAMILIAILYFARIRRRQKRNQAPVDKEQHSSTVKILLVNLRPSSETEELLNKTPSSSADDQLLTNFHSLPENQKSSLPTITNEDMVDTLTINDHFIDIGTSGAIYGPFRWNDRKCALKQIMFSPDEITEDLKKNILQKSNRWKQLDHKNVLKVFEVWLHPPALYIVMEYAEGKSLDNILRPRDVKPPYPPFSLEIIGNWALQIAEGMKYLHGIALVHRNLKSAHVLVMESPDVLPDKQTLKIGSYTSIREHDHATVMSNKGTLAWMAPEYIRGEPFSKLSDVWSYGITVFEILTRDVPYKEMRKETDIVRAAIFKTLMPTIPDSCPEPLKDLLTNCWNYEVDKRPGFPQICNDLKRRKIWEPYVTCPT